MEIINTEVIVEQIHDSDKFKVVVREVKNITKEELIKACVNLVLAENSFNRQIAELPKQMEKRSEWLSKQHDQLNREKESYQYFINHFQVEIESEVKKQEEQIRQQEDAKNAR